MTVWKGDPDTESARRVLSSIVLLAFFLVPGRETVAGTLTVHSGAARVGAFGLEAALSPECALSESLEIVPPPEEIGGTFESCDSIAAGAVTVTPPGALLKTGRFVELAEGFSVSSGSEFSIELDGRLATRFAYVEDRSPKSHGDYQAGFDLSLDILSLPAGQSLEILSGHDSLNGALFRVTVRRALSQPENRLILAARMDNGSYAETPHGEELLLPPGWNRIEIDWHAGEGDGFLLASLGGAGFVGLSGLENGSTVVDLIRLGAVEGDPGAGSGSVLIDEFSSSALSGGGRAAGCAFFPPDNIWNVPVDALPVDSQSATYIDTIGADISMHADFGSGEWPPGSGSPIGIPWIDVPAEQPLVDVSFLYADESDSGPYPIPADAPIEGGPGSDGDRHVLVVDRDACRLYELFYAFPQPDGSWEADSGAVFDLDSHALRADTWTSADAAGLPILPGLVRYEEVVEGAILHALRFTVPQTRRAYIWPARHYASSLTGTQYPPMGQRFRLRSDFDTNGFSTEVQVILQALKTYGMMLADNGSAWYLSGVPDEGWNNDELHELSQVTGADFEAVDVISLMLDPDSGQAMTTIFSDGFESGDTSAWSAKIP